MSLLRKLLTRSVSNKQSKELMLSSHDYCVLQVRKYDRENYLAGLCIRDEKLKRVNFALRAFNVELANIRDKTTDSDRAKVRFHFWSKLVEEIIRRNDITTESEQSIDQDKLTAYYNHSPIAKELFEIFHLINLNQTHQNYLKDLIGSRLSPKVLGYKKFETIDELLLYCSKSNESLYQLAWQTGCQLHNFWDYSDTVYQNVEKIAHNLGIAHGLCNVIRAIPYNATKNSCFVPNDLIVQHNLKPIDFTIGLQSKQLDGDRLKPIIKDLANRCQLILNQAHVSCRYVPSFFRDLFLPRVIVQSFLRRLRLCDYNICDPKLRHQNGLLPLSLWLNSKYNRLLLK